MTRLQVLQDDKPPSGIVPAPGFQKKGLAHAHWEPAFKCSASCFYCSSGSTLPMQYGRKRLQRLAAAQLPGVTWDEEAEVARDDDGAIFDPTHRPDLAITRDAEATYDKLAEQVRSAGQRWGRGKTLQLCQLVDPLLGPPVKTGLTLRAATLLLEKTSWRLRWLTKSDLIAREPFLSLWKKYPDRVVLGLSFGSLDDAWAAKMESGTSKPSARVRALHRLQDAGLKCFGMCCPIFANVAHDPVHVAALVDAIRPSLCETVWAEPENNRDTCDAVREVFEAGTEWRTWYDRVYPPKRNDKRPQGDRLAWSLYATTLYLAFRQHAEADGWLEKLVYLLYEDGIAAQHALHYADFRGVSLQAKPGKDGRSANPYIAALQASPEHGRTLTVAGPLPSHPGATR